ncbi:MAG TPA: phage holin family protein [Kofleriaceae bacterium]|nr:phage holin family protein [Kofleriaceae bacterium]
MQVTDNGRGLMQQGRERRLAAREDLYHARPAELLASALDDVRDIVALEVRSARIDLKKELARVKVAAALGSAGALFAAVGFLILMLLCSWLLALVLPTWAAYLIIGGGVFLIGLICLGACAGTASKVRPMPEHTAQDLKGDARWIREHASVRR